MYSIGKRGFTLLELLLVISIIAVLSLIIILVINPAEALRKSRDSQRLADLSTLKTAIGLYITSTTTPQLSNTNNTHCKSGNGTGAYASGDYIYYSLSTTTPITDTTLDGDTNVRARQAFATTTVTDGRGWLPINFDTITGGSPISNLPIDPVNTIADLANVASTDLVYRYGCAAGNLTYEIDAQLESEAFTVAPNDKRTVDGGNNDSYFETGTNMRILGSGTDF